MRFSFTERHQNHCIGAEQAGELFELFETDVNLLQQMLMFMDSMNECE